MNSELVITMTFFAIMLVAGIAVHIVEFFAHTMFRNKCPFCGKRIYRFTDNTGKVYYVCDKCKSVLTEDVIMMHGIAKA